MNEQVIGVIREQTEQTIEVAAELTECTVDIEREYITVVGGTVYDGSYEVTPKAWNDQILQTEGKLMVEDVTVLKVPYYETSNLFDGLTVFIAEETNG